MTSAPRPYLFDRVFDGDAVIEPVRPKRAFSLEEVEAARAAGYAEGERSAVATAEAAQAAALSETQRAAAGALSHLQTLAHAHRTAAAELALAVGRKIAGSALAQFPEAPLAETLELLARELSSTPRLIVRVGSGDPARLEATLHAAAERAGFEGQILLRMEPGAPPASFVFDWGEGRASFDPEAAAARVEAALRRALAAEAPAPPSPPTLGEA